MPTRPITRPITSPIARAITAAYHAWNPRALFAAGEQGVIYDPNDLSTLFQDSAGTTPVTAAGQPVGLMLDKRLGLVRGVELVAQSVIQGNAITTGSASINYATGASFVAGKWYEVSATVSNYDGTDTVGFNVGTVLGSTANYRSSNGVIRQIGFCILSSPAYVFTRGTNTCTFSNISIRELPGNHAYQSNAASRPMLRRNPVTGACYLETDGSDDWMQTNPIDFTGTDKISLFAGVRKLSDAAVGIICELGATTASTVGTFGLRATRFSAENTYGWQINSGTEVTTTTAGQNFPAPHSAVLNAYADIGSTQKIRVNGADQNSGTANAGTGNFGNHPLYLFRRAGNSLPFNGHFYGLTIVGRLCTDAETRNVERLYAAKTGVTLA